MRAVLLAGLVAVVPALSPGVAAACGGFFCSNVPIDQSAERIVFGIDPATETVTLHVQIFYQGAAEDFAWILPLPAVPDPFLSTDELFTVLANATQPRFSLDLKIEGDCEGECRDCWRGGGFDGGDDDDSVGDDDDASGVHIVEQQAVGPYDTVTLQADDAGALLEWLGDNGYDLPESLDPVLQPYVAAGSYFLALRLQNHRTAGDLQPLGVRFPGTVASIPIQLTSIAATDDMRLEVYVLGAARAVPDNYLHVAINEAGIDWFNRGANYASVVTRAADEAGGQAFATDFAGASDRVWYQLYYPGRYALEGLADLAPFAFVNALLERGFARVPAVVGLLRRYLPAPAGIDERDYYGCIDCGYDGGGERGVDDDEVRVCVSCYQDELPQGWDSEFDAAAFAAELFTLVVEPVQRAEALLQEHPLLTRLSSSMSAVEMTTDPIFVTNADLPDVDNQRSAELTYLCGNHGQYETAPRVLKLDDGRIILLPAESYTTGSPWSLLGAVAAARVEDASSSGDLTVLVDRTADMQLQLNAYNLDVLLDTDWAPPGTESVLTLPPAESDGCGCGATNRADAAALVLLVVLLRRRPRRA